MIDAMFPLRILLLIFFQARQHGPSGGMPLEQSSHQFPGQGRKHTAALRGALRTTGVPLSLALRATCTTGGTIIESRLAWVELIFSI